MTSAFNFAKVNASVPSLPQPSPADSRVLTKSCAIGAPLDEGTGASTTFGVFESLVVGSYPVTVNSHPPAQEAGHARAPSGALCGPGARGRLAAKGVHARTHGTFSGTIASFTYTDPHARASDFRATINWGGGHITHGRIVGRDGKFRVHGHHHFAKARLYRVRVRIAAPDGAAATAHSEVTVVHARAARRAVPGFTG